MYRWTTKGKIGHFFYYGHLNVCINNHYLHKKVNKIQWGTKCRNRTNVQPTTITSVTNIRVSRILTLNLYIGFLPCPKKIGKKISRTHTWGTHTEVVTNGINRLQIPLFFQTKQTTNVYDVRSAVEQPSPPLCPQITQYLHHLKTDSFLNKNFCYF